ncbi:MAG: hypothetical protein MK110_11445 [Fuerstiella sp.]|nr:hypothetical protein [Fuerstiella sp.]
MVTLMLPAIVCCPGLLAEDAIPLWQLSDGQKFAVEVATHRVTEISIGDHTTDSDITDRALLHYQMSGYDRSGRARLQVQIQSLDRTTIDKHGEKSIRSLDVPKAFRFPAVLMLVSDQGNAVNVVAEESVFRRDTGPSHHVLTQVCSDVVFRSWFDLPFCVPVTVGRPPFRPFPARNVGKPPTSSDSQNPPRQKADDDSGLTLDSEWTRTLVVSLGLPGNVRCDYVCSVDSIEKPEVRFSMQGPVGLVSHQFNDDLPLTFQDFQLTGSAFTGSGRILLDEMTRVPKSIQLDQNLTLAGQAIVSSGGRSREFRFKQSLTQTLNTSELGLTDLPDGVPLKPASADQR